MFFIVFSNFMRFNKIVYLRAIEINSKKWNRLVFKTSPYPKNILYKCLLHKSS